MATARSDLAWDDFRLIKAVADERTLPAAAARLRVDHSTVFRRLREVERRLGVQLFERHRSGYFTTSAGEEVVALAARMDEEITGLTRRIAGRTVSPAGELRVTTNDSLLVHLLTPLFARFREQCKDVRLDIVLANQALNLTKRDADVAIRATDRPPENLVGRRVATIAWALYGRAAEFPRPKDVREDALLERTWVSLGEDLASLNAVKFAREHVAAERVGYRVNTVLGLAEAIGQGIGIGHLPCFIGDTRADLVRLSPLKPEMATDLWLLTHPDLRNTPRVRVFLDVLAAEIVKQRNVLEGTSRRAAIRRASR